MSEYGAINERQNISMFPFIPMIHKNKKVLANQKGAHTQNPA